MISRDVVFHDRYGLHPRAARRIQASLDGITATVSLTKSYSNALSGNVVNTTRRP